MNRSSRFRTALVPIALWVVAAAGYALLASVLASRTIDENAGTGSAGADAFAYWLAGRHLVEGEPVYGLFAGGHGAFLYPPVIAQLLAPVSFLPLALFVWAWRAVELLALRWIVGSWRNTGISLLVFPALLGELEAGNVNLVVGAALAALIRGDGRFVGPSALPKFAALAALPAALARDRRGTVSGLAVAAVASLVSLALAPDLWRQYAEFLPHAGDPSDQFYNVGRLVPTPVRFAAAGLLAILAIRAPIYAPVAVTLASPVLWFHNLSVLTACVAAFPRLTGRQAGADAGVDDGPEGADSRPPTSAGAISPTTNRSG